MLRGVAKDNIQLTCQDQTWSDLAGPVDYGWFRAVHV